MARVLTTPQRSTRVHVQLYPSKAARFDKHCHGMPGLNQKTIYFSSEQAPYHQQESHSIPYSCSRIHGDELGQVGKRSKTRPRIRHRQEPKAARPRLSTNRRPTSQNLLYPRFSLQAFAVNTVPSTSSSPQGFTFLPVTISDEVCHCYVQPLAGCCR